MASTEHEFILVLFDEFPDLLRAFTVGGDAMGKGGVEAIASDLSQAKALHLLADRCFVFRSVYSGTQLTGSVSHDLRSSRVFFGGKRWVTATRWT